MWTVPPQFPQFYRGEGTIVWSFFLFVYIVYKIEIVIKGYEINYDEKETLQ
jgi:hypothetical protein